MATSQKNHEVLLTYLVDEVLQQPVLNYKRRRRTTFFFVLIVCFAVHRSCRFSCMFVAQTYAWTHALSPINPFVACHRFGIFSPAVQGHI